MDVNVYGFVFRFETRGVDEEGGEEESGEFGGEFRGEVRAVEGNEGGATAVEWFREDAGVGVEIEALIVMVVDDGYHSGAGSDGVGWTEAVVVHECECVGGEGREGGDV